MRQAARVVERKRVQLTHSEGAAGALHRQWDALAEKGGSMEEVRYAFFFFLLEIKLCINFKNVNRQLTTTASSIGG